MMKKNETLQPVSAEIPANGFYMAYRRFFDEVFIQDEFEHDKLRELYIYDRHIFSKPKFIPSKGWEKIEVLDDPELRSQFEIDQQFGRYEKELLSFLLINAKPKILKIVGEIGTGKSTFLQHMFFNFLPNQRFKDEGLYYLHFNLEKVFQQYEHYDYERVVELLEQEFPSVAKDSAVVSHNGLPDCPQKMKEITVYLKNLVAELKTSRVIICFDNVDVFKPPFQEILWRITEGLAVNTGATFVISMRKINSRYFETVSNSRFTSYILMEQRPPVFSKVVERRLVYFASKDVPVKDIRRLRIRANEITVAFSDFEEFVANFIKIIFSDEISNALDNLANYNVRVGLRWILTFIQSWNLNVVQMVSKLTKAIGVGTSVEGFATFDTLLNAIGLWNHRVYFPQSSSLENIFSANLKGSKADLLIKYRCLRYCQAHGDTTTKEGLVRHLRNLDYLETEIKEAVGQLLAHPKRLLFSNDDDSFDNIITLGLNPAGKYYLGRLLYYLDYFQLIFADCFLPFRNTRKSAEDTNYLSRIMEAIKFIRYIGEIELDEIESAIKNQRISLEEYRRTYGGELLSVSILRAVKENIRAIFGSMRSQSLAQHHCDRILRLIDLIVRELSTKYQACTQ
jgi:ABC-type dipeptide/oligopeptide/nickel transport system ATPase component